MRTLPELDPMRAHAPESFAAFAAAAAHVDAVLPAALVADVEHRVAAGLGLPADAPGEADGHAPIVDQFVVYSPGITESHRQQAAAALPPEVDLFTFLHAVYVADQAARQRLALSRIFGPLPEQPAEPAPLAPAEDLPAAIREMHAAAMRLDRVDPVTTELLRLRAADYHHCRVCAAVRLVTAAEAGADESFLDQRKDYEASSLSDAHKAVLRLTDAYMTHPAGIRQTLADDIRSHFHDAQIVEMLLDVSAFNLQKVYVALEIDAPPRDGDLALSFDERGHSVIV
jgi:alkylhydroperoxidase family enzyme